MAGAFVLDVLFLVADLFKYSRSMFGMCAAEVLSERRLGGEPPPPQQHEETTKTLLFVSTCLSEVPTRPAM